MVQIFCSHETSQDQKRNLYSFHFVEKRNIAKGTDELFFIEEGRLKTKEELFFWIGQLKRNEHFGCFVSGVPITLTQLSLFVEKLSLTFDHEEAFDASFVNFVPIDCFKIGIFLWWQKFFQLIRLWLFAFVFIFGFEFWGRI